MRTHDLKLKAIVVLGMLGLVLSTPSAGTAALLDCQPTEFSLCSWTDTCRSLGDSMDKCDSYYPEGAECGAMAMCVDNPDWSDCDGSAGIICLYDRPE
jgi:hypothetical protein